jgi:hypothetical protein
MKVQAGIGEILSEYGTAYINRNNIMGEEKGLIQLLSRCRTSALGSHYQMCDNCNYLGKSHNSCRNRHCPVCQQKDKLKWLNNRMGELLQVGYYHLVFTIPHQLNPLCIQNKKVMYDILFKAASQSILELCKDTKHLGADIGLITVLHTWGQNMMEHPHLHCIMPAGGLSFDKKHWVHTSKKNDFFIFYKVISRKFRGKFLDLLHQAYVKGELIIKGKLLVICGKRKFTDFIDKLYKKEWVVNIQPPIGKPEKILEYLSRYVFRIAISNKRIIEVKDGKVLFWWKNYRSGLFGKMSLETDEFIRRFLLHVLPKGFFKVRYYGIFASRYRKRNIETARQHLIQEQVESHEEAIEEGDQVWEKQNTVWDEILELMQNYQKPNCPQCKKGRLVFAGIVPKNQLLSPG